MVSLVAAVAAGIGAGAWAHTAIPYPTGQLVSTSTPAPVSASPSPSVSLTPTPSPTPTPTPPPDIHLSIGYAGDLLMHMPVMQDTPARNGDISGLTQVAAPWVSGVDLALCSMEVPVSPRGVASGFPVFGTLPGVVASLPATGWDGCTTASNHSWDQGRAGVLATADTFDQYRLGFTGTARTEEEAARPWQLYQLTRDGRTVTIAHLATTYGLNGFQADPAWSVSLNDADWTIQQAVAARQAGADIVVVSPHIGQEYADTPVDEQRSYAQALAASGQVDLLLGGHPHVPLTNERLEGGPGGSGMWVSYSAGNFISNQAEKFTGKILSTVGLFVWADLTVSEDLSGTRSVRIDALRWHPFTVDRLGGHRLVDLAAAHRGEVSSPTLSHAEAERRWNALMGVMNPETYSDEVPQPGGEAPTVLPRT